MKIYKKLVLSCVAMGSIGAAQDMFGEVSIPDTIVGLTTVLGFGLAVHTALNNRSEKTVQQQSVHSVTTSDYSVKSVCRKSQRTTPKAWWEKEDGCIKPWIIPTIAAPALGAFYGEMGSAGRMRVKNVAAVSCLLACVIGSPLAGVVYSISKDCDIHVELQNIKDKMNKPYIDRTLTLDETIRANSGRFGPFGIQ